MNKRCLQFAFFLLPFSNSVYAFQNYDFQFKMDNGTDNDIAFAYFADPGVYGIDINDGLKLTSLATSYAEMFTQDSTDRKLQINFLPKDLDEIIELPVYFRSTYEDIFALSVNKFDGFPDNWTLSLIDTARTDTTVLSDSFSVDVIHEGDFVAGVLTVQHYILRVNPGVETQDVSISGTTGMNGWRFLGSPYSNLSYDSLLSSVWTQGATGSDGPTGEASIYTWNESTQSFEAVTDFTGTPAQGSGFLAYLFEDDNPHTSELDGGWPKSFQMDGVASFGTIDFPVSFTSGNTSSLDGFNLVSNPYPFSIDWDAPSGWTSTNISDAIWIWDSNSNSGTGAYKVYGGGVGDDISVIAPNQGFWVKAVDASPSLSATEDVKNASEGDLLKVIKQPVPNFALKITSGGFEDALHISFRESSVVGFDKWDIDKMPSLSSNYLHIVSKEDSRELAIQSLPLDIEEVNIPIEITTSNPGTTELSLGDLSGLHKEFSVQLFDHQEKSFHDLKGSEPYRFQLDSTKIEFTLHLKRLSNVGIEDEVIVPEQLALNQNFPNPFNPLTNISFSIPTQAKVKLEVFDMLGKKVKVLVDATRNPGTYTVNFDASQLSNGLYLYRLQFEGKVLTRKMMLIK